MVIFQHATSHTVPAHLLDQTLAYLLANPTTTTTEQHNRKANRDVIPSLVKHDGRYQQQQHPSASLSTLLKQPQQEKTATTEPDVDIVDEDDRYLLYTDLPGVKLQDVQVQLKNNGSLLLIEGVRKPRGNHQDAKHYVRKLAVDDTIVDTSQPMKATLSDGTLEICAMKQRGNTSSNGPRRIYVVVGQDIDIDHPQQQQQQQQQQLILEVDIPGVKVDALEVVYLDGHLILLGHRKRGDQVTKVQRSFALDARRIDTNHLAAFLDDGVLTIYAPAKQPIGDVVIPVVAGGVEPMPEEKPKFVKKPRLIPVEDAGRSCAVETKKTTEPAKPKQAEETKKPQHNRSHSDDKLGWHKGFLLHHHHEKKDSDTDSTSSSVKSTKSEGGNANKKKRPSPTHSEAAPLSPASSVDSASAEKREDGGKEEASKGIAKDPRSSPPAPFKIVPETVLDENEDD